MKWIVQNGATRACFVIVLSLATVRVVHGEQAPVPLDELEGQSDLIIEADVQSVAKVGHAGSPGWCAQLRIRKTVKGPVQASPMTYWFVPPEIGMIGGRNESVFAGEHVKLYLVFEKGRYVAWASNSIETLDHFPDDRRILPTEYGEVIFADGTKSRPYPAKNCRHQ